MPAAFRSAAIAPSVEATVRCAVVVPFQVTANGVPSFQPPPTSIFAISVGPVSASRTTSGPGPGRYPADLGCVHDTDVTADVGAERNAGVHRKPGRGRHAGNDFETHSRLRARRGDLGAR